MSTHADAREAIERVVDDGGEADEVLRRVVAVLHEHVGGFIRISFVEGGELVPGPAAGEPAGTTSFPIAYEGRHVADLEADAPAAPAHALLEHVATLLGPYALVGWDTGGEEWAP